ELGVWVYDAYWYNRIFIFSADNEPIIALRDGGSVRAKAANESLDDLAPLLAELGTVDTKARISAFNAGVSDEPPHAMDFSTFEGRPALVGIMPILSYSGENAPPVGSEARYVAVTFLDDTVAAELGDQYRISGPQFTMTEPSEGTFAALPIMNRAGEPV